MASEEWCLIESDPWLFTDLLRKIGVSGVQVIEVCSLEDKNISHLDSIYGLLFLFKLKDKSSDPNWPNGGKFIEDNKICDIYFARQMITNACATQALINMLLNIKNMKDLDLGQVLKDFHEFTALMDFETRGHAISNCAAIREAHNSFSRPSMFALENESQENKDAYHYVAFVPIEGRLVELDGLKKYPIDHGQCAARWLQTAFDVLRDRMPISDTGDFNLLAITFDRKVVFTEEINQLQAKASEAIATAEEIDRLNELRAILAEEEKQQLRYEIDSVRRNHNWTPFVVEIMKLLAKYGQLSKVMEEQLQHMSATATQKEAESQGETK